MTGALLLLFVCVFGGVVLWCIGDRKAAAWLLAAGVPMSLAGVALLVWLAVAA